MVLRIERFDETAVFQWSDQAVVDERIGIGRFGFGKILDEKFQYGSCAVDGGRRDRFEVLSGKELVGALKVIVLAFFDAHLLGDDS